MIGYIWRQPSWECCPFCVGLTYINYNNSTIIIYMSSLHWSYYDPDRFSTGPAISSSPARSSEPEIPPEPVIPGSDLRTPESTRHDSYRPRWPSPSDSWAMLLYRKGGYPWNGESLSLLPRIFRRHQHPPIGCQPRSPVCSTTVRWPLYAHAGLFRTPWVSQPDSPQVRTDTSEMSHFSLGYTKWRRSCASPDYTDLQSRYLLYNKCISWIRSGVEIQVLFFL